MKKVIYFSTFFVFLFNSVFAQSIDDVFSQNKMRKDLKIFKEIRFKANSGLYKYRTKVQIDSIYDWAEKEIEKALTHLHFYNIICQLTDFEGSLHNDTDFPKKYLDALRKENNGYFPYPIKWIEGKWIINYENGEIPFGAEIVEINGVPMAEVILNLYKYYSTDGLNITGKKIGIRTNFSKYYRFNYGKKEKFEVVFKLNNSNLNKKKTLNSIGFIDYYKNFINRYSKPFDQIYYADLKENEKYKYEKIDASTGVLTIFTFDIGNETTKEHKAYVTFLDSVFAKVKEDNLKNLIVDVRQNAGGNDPNDIVTYSYLTQRNFQENKQAWISFRKIPFLRYYDINVPQILRPFVVGKYNKELQKIFPLKKSDGYYQTEKSDDQQIRTPNKNSFINTIYLLVSPEIASAGSLFAAMVAGNENTITVGEETMGGYYGHNGHTPLEYKLPKSKIEFSFSMVNLEQDVPIKQNQFYNKGIIPDYNITQTFEDYINQKDTQMIFVLDLIKKNSAE